MQNDLPRPPRRLDEKASPPPTETPRPVFERPRVRRLGTLPAVTTAFGGSFLP